MDSKRAPQRSLLLSTEGTWSPDAIIRVPSPLRQRPGSAYQNLGSTGEDLAFGKLPNKEQLFNGNDVIVNAQLNSVKVEERAIEHDVVRALNVLPEQTRRLVTDRNSPGKSSAVINHQVRQLIGAGSGNSPHMGMSHQQAPVEGIGGLSTMRNSFFVDGGAGFSLNHRPPSSTQQYTILNTGEWTKASTVIGAGLSSGGLLSRTYSGGATATTHRLPTRPSSPASVGKASGVLRPTTRLTSPNDKGRLGTPALGLSLSPTTRIETPHSRSGPRFGPPSTSIGQGTDVVNPSLLTTAGSLDRFSHTIIPLRGPRPSSAQPHRPVSVMYSSHGRPLSTRRRPISAAVIMPSNYPQLPMQQGQSNIKVAGSPVNTSDQQHAINVSSGLTAGGDSSPIGGLQTSILDHPLPSGGIITDHDLGNWVPYQQKGSQARGGSKVRGVGSRPTSAFASPNYPANGVLSRPQSSTIYRPSSPTRSGSRPMSAFSAAAATVRQSQTASHLQSVLVSVAEQPVYSEEGDIKTSYDVVTYFTQHGHGASKKLFYLNKATTPNIHELLSPFHLVVVPHEKINRDEYWTMSTMGVVHVEQGRENEGEFTELGEWIRLSTMYDMLRKLRFFKHFRICKSFRAWNYLMRRSHYKRLRDCLSLRLYPAVRTFQPILIRISGIIHALSETKVVQITPRMEKVYTLEEFVQEQDKHRADNVIPSINAKVEEIVKLLCDVSAVAELDKFKMESMTDVQELAAQGYKIGMPKMSGGKQFSIAQLKADMQVLLDTYQRCVWEVSRLPALMRLVDYMVVEAFVAVAVRTMSELRTFFQDPDRVRGTFLCTVSFLEEGFSFTPDHEYVAAGVEGLLNSWLRMLAEMSRPLSSKILSTKYLERGEGLLNVEQVITQTPKYQELKAACLHHIHKSYSDTAKYVHHTFEEKRALEHFRLSWSLDAYQQSSPVLTTLQKDLQQQRRWGRTVDQMKMSTTVGLLCVDSKKMRSVLQEAVLHTIEDMKQVVLLTAQHESSSVQEKAKLWCKELEQRPEHLDGYATARIHLSEMARSQEELFKHGHMVDDLYELYKDYGSKLNYKDQIALDIMHELLVAVKQELAAAESWLSQRHDGMKEELVQGSTQLGEDALSMLQNMSNSVLNDAESEPSDMLGLVHALETKLLGMEDTARRYLSYQKLLDEPGDDYGNLLHVRREFERRKAAWVTLSEWLGLTESWLSSPCVSIKSEEVQSTTDEYFKKVYKMIKIYRDDMVVAKAKDMIEDFKLLLPLISEACNPALQEHHWKQVFKVLEIEVEDHQEVTLENLLHWGAMEKLEAISMVSTTASKEYSLRNALTKMKGEWQDKEFYCLPYKETKTSVVGQTEEIQMLLDDQLMKVQAMNASPFVKAFKQDTVQWEKTLTVLQELLDEWILCQSTWMYLEPIFSSPDIVKQMPEEGEKFQAVDGTFRSLMEEAIENPACIPMASDIERINAIKEANRLLEEVQRGLAAYLEKKRLYFPRFFFLSNDEMLEILSETKDPTRVQPHLRKCFEGIHRLVFSGPIVTAITSAESELVPLKVVVNTAQAKGSVERWLLEVEDRMFEAVHDVTSQGVAAYLSKPRHEWMLDWPGMVVLVVAGIFWTRGTEEALTKRKVKEYAEKCNDDLMKVVDAVRGELTSLQRATLGALVVMDVHSRDVVTQLVADQVASSSDFEWQAQLRTYWDVNEMADVAGYPDREYSVVMRMMSSRLEYGYEYLGNSSRLVITPLTDRCYRTLMGAIHMNLGGAPEGPAGTGKTETTKDLAKALARQCVVFNCSDSLDYIAMGKFFKGLAASGAWACFDEFNRIDLEVLSVVAQQVMDIQRAIASKLTAFTFEGTDMQLKWSAWCAITMNPGYAGRSELPDNLKALFRTVAMMVPDYAMISEIILFSYGYLRARECAKKIVQCYKLCSEQLSSQDHYDYGMRAVIAVLRAAGNLKRRSHKEDEFVLMLRSIMDVNLCKFLSNDVPLFKGIISDLFPGVVLPKPDYHAMEMALVEACSAAKLQPTEYFLLKTIQLYEMIVVRHGLMMVGQPWSGKTSSYRVLASALGIMAAKEQEGQVKVHYHVINPKSITMGQLYGQFDPVSHEWSDGILAVTFRHTANDISGCRQWLVLDGPVDAVWIENMNTVLDDNKKLCLNSGEIIQMSSLTNMLFEVGDLAAASPATVSRCGMVYLEPHQLGTQPLIKSWLQSLPVHIPENVKSRLELFYQTYGTPLVRFLRREVKEANPTTEGSLVTCWMRLVQALALPVIGTPESYKHFGGEQRAVGLLDALCIFSLIWSNTCTAATSEGRALLSSFLNAMLTRNLSSYSPPSGHRYYTSDWEYMDLTASGLPPTEGVLYDWMFDTQKMGWKRWTDLIDDIPIPEDASYKSIIVPTADSVTVTYLLDLAVENKYPLLLVGPTGTGKTVYSQRYLLGLNPEFYTPPNFVGFSAQTSANMTQQLIDAKLDKRRKGVYGPPLGKRAVIFVDDLNMPQKEEYGAQPPIELLRQFMDHSGWYDRENIFRNMLDCQFVAAMGPPGGGRTSVTSRYTRHFSTCALTEPSKESLIHIFSTIQDWFLITHSFPRHVLEIKDKMVAATVLVYNTVMTQLLPTPTKSHYVFNLRDFSRVFQGLQMQDVKDIDPGSGSPVAQRIKLWVHEILRVFYDRLVDEAEQQWFLDLLRQTTKDYFGIGLDELLKHLTKLPGVDGKPEINLHHLRRLFFGDYLSEPDADGLSAYVEITDPESIMSRMEANLMDYNSLSKRPMNLAMFLYAVEHTSRIARVLRQEGGHMLCVGVGGSGRQSLARLAAFICGMETFQIEISRSYGTTEWREDLKRLCRRAGGDNKPSVLLFSDMQIKSESFVEDINNLLNTGEVPNMFPYDERASVAEQVRSLAKKMGRALDTPQELWSFFVERTRSNLHLVLCFSPIGDAFRERLRQFPSLINCCTIDWFQQWPEDALEAVAAKFLKNVDLTSNQRTQIKAMCKMFHTSVAEASHTFLMENGRHNYVTPTSYLELISAFTTLLGKRRSEVKSSQSRYEVGLDKLAFTSQQVEVMRQELRALKPVLEKTVGETEKLLTRIDHEKTTIVEPKKIIVDEEVKQADLKAQAAKAIKQECESILEEAIPALNAAISALDTIKAADIRLVQTFKSPPATVKLVMEAVCVMMDVKPTMVADPNLAGKRIADYWDASKKLLMDSGFINTLKAYDRDNIPGRIIDKVRKEYISDPDFTPSNAAKASGAAEGLCKWVHAMDSYDRVAKVVAPKKQALEEAESEYNSVMAGLLGKQEELAGLMQQLQKLEGQLSSSMAEKKRLEHEVEQCALKLDRAEKLISGLGGERERWTECAAQLKGQFRCLTGDLLMAAAVVSYLGAFTAPYRDRMVSSWSKQLNEAGITSSGQFSLSAVLGDPVKIREWVIAGLPNDTFSIDNAIMAFTARRWPLCIDPQKQANKWIKTLEEKQGLKVLKATDTDYMRVMESAIQFGLPVLLENVGEELDPSLEPLLLKQVFKQGGVSCIKLGDNTVEYSETFRFYITTALRNPHYLPDTAVKVTLLNFMITQEGLSDQLLGVVVAQEMPDLEEQRQQLVVTSADNKRRLKEIEDQILSVLSNSQGNILEDATAVQILSEAKKVSDDITAKQAVSEETQTRIDSARKGYRMCGEYNAALFFCISDLAGIDAMYQYSLNWFVTLFIRSIVDSSRSEVLSRRLDAINNHFTYALYCNVCRSLFEKDKLLFAYLLATRILTFQKQLPPAELQFLITGGAGTALSDNQQSNPDPTWITDQVWGAVLRLSKVSDVLATLPFQVKLSVDGWRTVMNESESPHEEELPGQSAGLSGFQKLLILRCFRPDKLSFGLRHFVIQQLGEKFVEPPTFDLKACFEDSSCSTPLLFVLSSGTDPTAALLKFSEQNGNNGKLQVISMGQGQGPKAAALIEEARGMGSWVLLQNCHLAPSWMPNLDKACEAITPDITESGFRLWMTSMPSTAFPPNVLQNSVKMTMEPPAGLRANMRRSLTTDPAGDPRFWEASQHPEIFKKLLFGLLFIHAFVQERRRFGPIGWNVPYGFDDGDLRISCRQVLMYINEAKTGVPFAALQYAIGECNYGGRITDDKDRRIMKTLMSKVYCASILDDNFLLSESGRYFVPVDGPLESYVRYVESLPSTQKPEVFGLHANADISKNLGQSMELLSSLLSAKQGGGGAAVGSQAGSQAATAATVKDLIKRLPSDFDLESALDEYPVSYSQSMNQVLIQEMARYNRLLAVVRTSLTALDRALAGLEVMSGDLEAVSGALSVGKVPALWLSQSYPSLKPLGSYVNDLLSRLGMLSKWLDEGQPNAFWISGFFFTPSFTTAVLQNFARQHKLPIDEIGFEFEIMSGTLDSYNEAPVDGAYIHGLFLEGCTWDEESKQLSESHPKVLFVAAPVIWLRPTRVSDMRPYQHYECPVYRTADRRGVLATTGHSTNFLMMVKLPTTTLPPEHWILRGVCMLCSLSE
ncbi:hypothetical protein CEUSTIGMA_g4520.t1 [Chlamydomonas eustigma]|uniref:Dynein heavy chain n=1 Tax=Chlamydomonas eustigma TaxID=1157962 RepID=A0A250X1U8_9CHLO|nr:hypothetical protein CEUSTIGMA_g4520.t1 [Chlamydomonas eustigma]|eukprot:GAX77074.1 hypothetical protein CEUSTIGMA_g4520.t1 [Chlamydomonas eustigma]